MRISDWSSDVCSSDLYQARFMRYLEHRSLAQPSDRKVRGVFGDGEMDEPESIAALTLAAREKLSNLVFVVNCNLQRLDGPVRGHAIGKAAWRERDCQCVEMAVVGGTIKKKKHKISEW